MIDKEQLKKMIKSQEESLKKMMEQLNELKAVARENGIVEEQTNFVDFNSSSKISSEIERKRQEVFNSIQGAREEVQLAAKKAIEEAKNNIASSLKSINNFSNEGLVKQLSNVNLPQNSGGLPIDFLKERSVKGLGDGSDEKMKKIIEELREKKKNKLQDVLVASGTPQVTEEVTETSNEVVEEIQEIVEETK